MIITEEAAELRLSSPDNLGNKLLEIRALHSNRTGPKGLATSTKDMMVGLSKLTTQQSVAETFGVTQAEVSYLDRAGYGKDEKEKIHEAAMDAMLQSIKLIPDKLKTTKKATDLSTVAANLARVVEKTSPKQLNQTNVKVLVYAPRIKSEDEFEEAAVSA